jgi:hypothetical protein
MLLKIWTLATDLQPTKMTALAATELCNKEMTVDVNELIDSDIKDSVRFYCRPYRN